MKTLKGWHRFTPLRNKIIVDIALASSDARLLSIAKRALVVETAIRVMNHRNGMFLDKGMPTLKTVERMREIRAKMLQEKL